MVWLQNPYLFHKSLPYIRLYSYMIPLHYLQHSSRHFDMWCFHNSERLEKKNWMQIILCIINFNTLVNIIISTCCFVLNYWMVWSVWCFWQMCNFVTIYWYESYLPILFHTLDVTASPKFARTRYWYFLSNAKRKIF